MRTARAGFHEEAGVALEVIVQGQGDPQCIGYVAAYELAAWCVEEGMFPDEVEAFLRNWCRLVRQKTQAVLMVHDARP